MAMKKYTRAESFEPVKAKDVRNPDKPRRGVIGAACMNCQRSVGTCTCSDES